MFSPSSFSDSIDHLFHVVTQVSWMSDLKSPVLEPSKTEFILIATQYSYSLSNSIKFKIRLSPSTLTYPPTPYRIVISKFLKRCSKVKRTRAPAYSPAYSLHSPVYNLGLIFLSKS